MRWKTPEPPPETPTARTGRDTRRRSYEQEPRRDTSRRSKNGEGLQYFTEFLQETPPPVHNVMSMPDSFSITSSEDGSWARVFRTIRRRRRKGGRKHHPPVIMLPDSAVAATTTGGYRHIAISIPIEHSYLNSAVQSQTPIFECVDAEATQEINMGQNIESRFVPPQSRSAERGSISVLQTVAEDRESSPVPISPSPQPDSTQSITTPRSHHSRDSAQPSSSSEPSSPRRTRRPKTPPNASMYESKQPAIGERTTKDSVIRRKPQPIVVVPEMIPTLSSRTRRATTRSSQETNNPATKLVPESPLHISDVVFPLPERRASRLAVPPQETRQTIAGMINSWMSQKTPEDMKRRNSRLNSYDRTQEFHRPRGSVAESMMSTTSEPRIFDAQAAKAYQHIPIIIRPPSQHNKSPKTLASSSSSPQQAIAAVIGSEEPAAAGIDPVQKDFGHSDHVHQTKQKDIEVAEPESQMRKPSVAIHLMHDGSVQIWPESPGLRRLSDVRSSSMSLQPSHFPGKHSPFLQRPSRHELPETPEYSPAHIPASMKIFPSDSLAQGKDSPSSHFSGSPISSYEPLSSYHPTEKRTESHENDPKAQYAAQKQAKEKEVVERPSQQDLAIRYERLKETRQRDMEKRLHRLERNGEVWLRSIVPMMESINRLLEKSRQESRQSQPPLSSPPVKTHRAPQSSLDQLSPTSRNFRSPQSVGSQGRLKRRPAKPDLVGTTRVPQAIPLPSSSSSSLSSIAQSKAHGVYPLIPGSFPGPPTDDFDAEILLHRKTRQHHMADISKDASVRSNSSHNGSSSELETLEHLMREYQGGDRFGMSDFGSTGLNGGWETAKMGGQFGSAGGEQIFKRKREVKEQSTQTRTGKSREGNTQARVQKVRTVGTQTREEDTRYLINRIHMKG